MKPHPTIQQPQNPEALQEYFLSHKISQSLIYNIIIDKYCAYFVSWIDHKTIHTATITVTLHWSITPSRHGNCTGMLVQTVPQHWVFIMFIQHLLPMTMMTRGQKPLPCLNLCLNDSIRRAMFDRLQFFIPLPDFLQTKSILLVFLRSVTCTMVI